jgi:hypothetical protein
MAVMFLLYFLLYSVWGSGVGVCVCFVCLRGGEEWLLFFPLVIEEL